jgi:hypothetical protein
MVYDFQVLMPQQGRRVWYQPALVHDGSCHRRPWRPWQSELFENLVSGLWGLIRHAVLDAVRPRSSRRAG